MDIYIRKIRDYWEWNDSIGSGHWRSFTDGVKTREDMIKYFVEGGHQNRKGGNFNPPEALILVNEDNQPYTHYSIKLNHETGLHSATVDYDPSKRKIFTTTELWPEDDQLRYLRGEAVHLPRDVDRLKDAVAYLQAEEPFTVDEYRSELDKRLKEGIETRLKGETAAVTEFQQ